MRDASPATARSEGSAVGDVYPKAVRGRRRASKRPPGEARVYTLRPENRFRLDPAFVRSYIGAQPNWGYGLLSYVTFKRTYARRVDKRQLGDESVRRHPLHQSLGVDERAVQAVRGALEDAVEADGVLVVGHGGELLRVG